MTRAPLLEIDALSVSFGAVRAVQSLGLALHAGERLGLLGESGSGKTITARAIAGLLPEEAQVCGAIRWPGPGAPPVAGRDIGFVFQDPMSSLNPVLTVGEQIGEVLLTHGIVPPTQVPGRVMELLDRVGIPESHARVEAYPYEFSGGQRQRIAIAIAISATPRLLIADEPTSSLDTVVQAQVMALLDTLTRDSGMALLLITHDLALAARSVDRIAVMYAGRLAELGPVAALLQQPRHPYTQALLASQLAVDAGRGSEPPPEVDATREERRPRLPEIPGALPAPGEVVRGCPFAARCAQVRTECGERFPAWRGDANEGVACWGVGAVA